MKSGWFNEIQEMLTTYPDAPYVLAGAVALIFVLWLILRSVKLWYWKINDRKETLERISDTLDEIREEICDKADKVNAGNVPPQSTVLVQSDNTTVVVQQPQQPQQLQETPQAPQQEPGARQMRTGDDDNQLQPEKQQEKSTIMVNDNLSKDEIGVDTEIGAFKYMTRDCNRDKMGRVYTREEIEANIKA